MGDPGVVHQNMDPAAAGVDAGHYLIDGLGIGDVAQLSIGGAAGGADLIHGAIHFVQLAVQNVNGRAFPGKQLGDGQPDAGGASGDDGVSRLKSKHGGSSILR